MSNRKAVLAMLPLTLLVGLVSFSFGNHKTNNQEFEAARVLERNNVVLDGNEEQLDSSKLKVKLLSSSISKTSQSFGISFSTGGVGWFNGLKKTVLVASEDPEFEEYYNEFNSKTEDEKNAMLLEEDFAPRYFSSYLYSIYTSKDEIVIPKQLWRGGKLDSDKTITDENGEEIENPNYGLWKDGWFCLEPTSINNPVATDWTGSKVKNIYIPSTITTISENAFEGIPASVVIHLEYQQEDIPADFADGWNHDAQVEYGYNYEEEFGFDEEKTSLAYQNAILPQFQQEFGDKELNYFIGYYPEEGEQYPLTATYKLKDSDEVKTYTFTKTSQSANYDAVGYNLIAFTTDLNCDIPINDNEEIDPESITIHNIYVAKEEDGSLVPDFSKSYYIGASKSYGNATNIDDFVSCRYSGLSTFMGYTNISMLSSITNYDTYSVLKPSFYRQYENEIISHKYYIRYRFTALGNVDFYATYNNQEVIVNVKSPVSQTILSKQNNNLVSFLVKDSAFGPGFSVKKLQSFAFKSLSVTIDIISNEGKPIARSNVTTRFANVVVMPYSENGVNYLDINAMVLIEVLAYVVVFTVIAVILYFYLKNKYKNDEFRRMNTKQYVKKGLLGLFGSLIVILEVTFVILRTGVFSDSVVVFNPTDVFIIILGILSILIIGYFGRYLYVSIKAGKERRRTIRLKLDEDVADDGTN